VSLEYFAAIGVELFQPYVMFWAVLFVVDCCIIGIFVGLGRLLMSRINP
jgi:hypothetical protein